MMFLLKMKLRPDGRKTMAALGIMSNNNITEAWANKVNRHLTGRLFPLLQLVSRAIGQNMAVIYIALPRAQPSNPFVVFTAAKMPSLDFI